MSMQVAERALHDRRRGLAGWSIGMALYVAMIVAFWPSIEGSTKLTDALQDYPDALKEFFGGAASFDFSSPVGYLNAELFSLVVPLLLVIFAIGWGASTVAGEQERGLLDLIMLNPVPRRRIILEKAASLGVGVFAVGLAAAVALLAVGTAFGVHIGLTGLIAASAGAALLAVFHGYLALLVGAATGSRATAIGVAAAVFTTGYLLQALAGLVSWLEPVRSLSPFYLYNGSVPLAHGFPILDYLALAALALVALAGTVMVFERRDLVG